MRLLLIEDDPGVATVLSRLARAEHFSVDTAADGRSGEELACVNEYDVIILDRMLPHQDGLTTCSHIREHKVLTPILMLTALGGVDDRVDGLNGGADDYLAKPFHTGELLARIRSLVRRHTDVRTTTLVYAGVVMDQRTHTVTRDGVPIALTAKEYAFLEYLMLHPGTLLSRDAISEHIWDMNFEPRSNVIESYVKFLRQKIDHGFTPPLIHTVRGAGYLFSDTPP